MTRRSASAGNKYSGLGFLNDDGILIGGSPTAPAAGAAGSGLIRLLGIKQVPLRIPDSQLVQDTGDDDLIAEFDFDSIESRRYIATMAVEDLDLLSALTGVPVESIAGGDWVADDITNAPEYNVCLIHQARAKKQDSTNRGEKAWQGVVVNLATAKYLGRDEFNERAPGVYRLSITPQLASYKPWGQTILDGALTEASRLYRFRSDFPYWMHAFTGTGALSTFNLDYKPVSALNELGQQRYLAVVNRLARAVSSVNDSTLPYTFTLGSAAPNNGAGSFLYQINAA